MKLTAEAQNGNWI